MKPRTKMELEVFFLSQKLPKLSKEQEQWAHKECLEHKGFESKTKVICLDCGDTFSPKLVKRKRAVCPHCGTKIKIEDSRKRTDKQHAYFALATIWNDFQVVRNFELYAHYKKGAKARYFIHEILQYWITPKGKITMVGHNHNLSGYCDSWGSDWSIRKNRSAYYYNHNKYRIYPDKYSPDSVFKEEYTRIGINSKLDGLSVLDAIRIIPENPRAETLLKAKQYSLLYRFKDYSGGINREWPSIKICLRNKYKIKDAEIWLDYLELLRFFNRDLRNAKYVCPKNLKKAHDRLVKKKRDIQKKEQIRLQRERVKQAQKDYAKNKKPFMGMLFSKGNIQVRFLNSVKEVMEEGDLLKHCVFVNNYHEKNTLLFSAIVNGQRTATVEIDPQKLKIVQIRGSHNNPTEYDEKIKNLIQKNMNRISEKIKSKRKLQIAS